MVVKKPGRTGKSGFYFRKLIIRQSLKLCAIVPTIDEMLCCWSWQEMGMWEHAAEVRVR